MISSLQSNEEKNISFYSGLDLMEEGTRIPIVYFFFLIIANGNN